MEAAQKPAEMLVARILDAVYRAVHNASWSLVNEACDGIQSATAVQKGTPPQPWRYRVVHRTLELSGNAEEISPFRPRLLVLGSEKQWPYSLRKKERKTG
ncbi:retrotransposon hot spot (RHS) protein [Trypanosoma conorhini]|uniref:Retrotransposon hot spot (RHS) protein n=1 Tax=Trypanosoma conorhini TaxID=83891 RepID=A0A422Q6X3_9TRYP|nr:retrotransposon hot spot (RHS) protein [Trypanosoma conorhini]RNF25711.1 retrotransposon hot spot (RHS) protein [Trypanosoma conorhini]